MIDGDLRPVRLPSGLTLRVAAVVADETEGYGSPDEFIIDSVRRGLEAAELRQWRRRGEGR
jgi:hypothetical protein